MKILIAGTRWQRKLSAFLEGWRNRTAVRKMGEQRINPLCSK